MKNQHALNTQHEIFQKFIDLLPWIKVIDASSFQLLGSFILDDGILNMLSTGLDNVKILFKQLPLLDIHTALRVLRCSTASQRFQYLLRTCSSSLQSGKLSEIDEFYRQTLEDKTGNKITADIWIQASLLLSAFRVRHQEIGGSRTSCVLLLNLPVAGLV